MKIQIDPLVDCVFKAIFGQPKNTIALIHFLNSILKLDKASQIKSVTVENPYNERELREGKLTIVDIKATDEKGHQYQIEIQLAVYPALTHRILYTWSSIYHAMIQKSEDFKELKQAISIWILGANLFPEVDDYQLPFFIYNPQYKICLTDHLMIHVIQLPKWRLNIMAQSELDRWMYLFTEGKNIDVDNPPEILQTEEMKPVLETLRKFSENEEDYHLYENRRIAQMEANTIRKWQKEIEEKNKELNNENIELQIQNKALQNERKSLLTEKKSLLTEKKSLLTEKESLLTEKESLQTEKESVQTEKESLQRETEYLQTDIKQKDSELERLKALLKQSGIDPDKK